MNLINAFREFLNASFERRVTRLELLLTRKAIPYNASTMSERIMQGFDLEHLRFSLKLSLKLYEVTCFVNKLFMSSGAKL